MVKQIAKLTAEDAAEAAGLKGAAADEVVTAAVAAAAKEASDAAANIKVAVEEAAKQAKAAGKSVKEQADAAAQAAIKVGQAEGLMPEQIAEAAAETAERMLRQLVFQRRCITFLCRTSHASKGTAALATVSITEVALEEELARVEEDDGAPSAVEAAASEAAAMGDLWQQMVETVVTDEAEAARKAEEGRLAKEAAEAEAAKKAEEDLLLEKQLSLLAKLQRSVSKRRSSRSNQERCSCP